MESYELEALSRAFVTLPESSTAVFRKETDSNKENTAPSSPACKPGNIILKAPAYPSLPSSPPLRTPSRPSLWRRGSGPVTPTGSSRSLSSAEHVTPAGTPPNVGKRRAALSSLSSTPARAGHTEKMRGIFEDASSMLEKARFSPSMPSNKHLRSPLAPRSNGVPSLRREDAITATPPESETRPATPSHDSQAPTPSRPRSAKSSSVSPMTSRLQRAPPRLPSLKPFTPLKIETETWQSLEPKDCSSDEWTGDDEFYNGPSRKDQTVTAWLQQASRRRNVPSPLSQPPRSRRNATTPDMADAIKKHASILSADPKYQPDSNIAVPARIPTWKATPSQPAPVSAPPRHVRATRFKSYSRGSFVVKCVPSDNPQGWSPIVEFNSSSSSHPPSDGLPTAQDSVTQPNTLSAIQENSSENLTDEPTSSSSYHPRSPILPPISPLPPIPPVSLPTPERAQSPWSPLSPNVGTPPRPPHHREASAESAGSPTGSNDADNEGDDGVPLSPKVSLHRGSSQKRKRCRSYYDEDLFVGVCGLGGE
ncbi:hypothetical protein LTR50_003199 [Elasticomyces elasticus]|nr:hypothetical protein LTR50_003199 [Elasticomyces elasticus]